MMSGRYVLVVRTGLQVVVIFLLGEEAKASPSIANTLWRVWTMFTRLAITRRKWTDFDEIWGTPSLFLELSLVNFGRDPRRSGSGRASRSFVFFGPLNNARFHRLPVGQLSRNLHKKTCSRVLCGAFGKHLRKFAHKGSFFPKKPPFWLDQSQRFPTSGIDFSEMITNLGKSWQLGWTACGMLAFHWHRWNELKVIPLACSPRIRRTIFPPKYSYTASMGDDFTACCITQN